MDTASGEHLILALYVNMVSVSLDDPDATQKIAGEALGEIAAAAYDAPLPKPQQARDRKCSRQPEASSTCSSRMATSSTDPEIPWVSGDIAIRGDRIAAIGNLRNAHAKRVIDAQGLVVSPGFIDMLGQSEVSLAHR